MRGFVKAFAMACLVAWPSVTFAQDIIPEKRFALTQDADLAGGDIASIFDTTLEACQRACLTNTQCTAFTYNTRNSSCFIKSNPGEGAFFAGAYSGLVLTRNDGAEDLATTLRPDLARFLADADIAGATKFAEGLANIHVTNGWTAAEHQQSAADAEARRAYDSAVSFTGAALNLTDQGDGWAEYARLSLAAARMPGQQNRFRVFERAFFAAINAYLRTENPAARHSILVLMADALEQMGRGRDTVSALRLAQSLQPRDDTSAALDNAIGKYGFRIVENQVQSDSARPRICVTFSEDLAKAGVDYENYVQLPAAGLTVTSDGWRNLCVEGVTHGSRQTILFREGLPAADGQEMAKSVPITAYVRDRSPGVRFPGRAYMLPKTGSAAIPVDTVNADKLNLTLFAVTDRNLLRAFQSGFFGQPLQDYQEPDFSGQIGAEIWSGTATVGIDVNKDTTTRLPMDDALKGRPAGVYALKAAIPGVDPYVTPAGWQWFVVSDLGLTSLEGVDGLHVFVRSLGTAGALEGVTVELLSTANAVLGTASTDAMGYARFDAGLTRGTGGEAPALIVARQGETDVAFLSLTDPEFDLSDRGVEGREAAPPVDVFLTTDRGAYRAGETVFATALARDAEASAVPGLPLTALLKRPDGVEYSRSLVADGGMGGHVFALPIAGGAPRGVWRLEVYADLEASALASQTFLVEDFLPERIDFDLALASPEVRLGDTPQIDLTARYLFGAPGADLAIEGEVLLSAATQIAKFPGYVFGRHNEPFSSVMESISAPRTDDDGRARIDVTLPAITDPLRPLEARFTVRVAEGSGRPVERRVTQLLTPSAAMIGVKPLFDDVVGEGTDARFNLIGVGADQTATPMQVKWEVTRIETDYQWYQNYGSWNWEPVYSRTLIAEGTVDLGADAIEVSAPVTWGEYELLVERTDGPTAATSTSFYAGWYAPADVSATPDTLELSLDKPAYKPGDTATLRIVPRAAGTALITVLSNRLVAMQAVEVTEGENLITLPVTNEWGAGVYVTASVLRPMDVAAGRNPARALGLAHAAIDPGTRALNASIETAPEAAPRGPMDVAVKVDGLAAGDTAFATIAAVDVGILNLTGFEAPDPKGHYFGQRKLGVGIRDVYGRLIDGLNGAEGTVRSGGDAGAQARLSAPPPTEELVAYFTGPVQVGSDGYARATFDLPSFNGTVKVMAVVWSAKGVGQAQADVLVRDPVVVTASLPRFMAPGDQSRLLLEIVHATGPSGRMGLDIKGNGLTLGSAPSGFDLADNGKAVYAVPVTAIGVGIHTIDIALTTPDGKQLKKTLTIPVQMNDPEIVRVSRLDLDKGQTFTFDDAVFTGFVPGTGKATMAIGPIARLNAPGILAALDRYPYGCTEQMTSKALPLLYFDEVAQAMNLPGAADIRLRVEQAVAEILTNQSSGGSFGLWGPGNGDMWLDAFVTDFLSRARSRGYTVPDIAFRQALDNLRNQVNYTADFDSGGEAVAYALMVLAREGAAAVGDLRYYVDVKGDAFSTPMSQAQLGAALASYGDQARADVMFRKAGARMNALAATENEQIFRADYGTNFRDAAAVLALAVESGSNAIDREVLTSRISTTRTLSTQEATWALLAANALIDSPGGDGITINGGPATGPLVRVLDAGSTDTVVVKNGSASDTKITITTYGVPSEAEPAGGNGYAINRRYYTLEGVETNITEGVAVGTRLVTVLEVIPFARGEARLIVTDPLPAGLEIDNPNLMTGGNVAALTDLGLEGNVAHSEFRQERFISAIDRYDNKAFRLAYIVRAVSPGTYHHPAASVDDMYRPDFKARGATGTLTITE